MSTTADLLERVGGSLCGRVIEAVLPARGPSGLAGSGPMTANPSVPYNATSGYMRGRVSE